MAGAPPLPIAVTVAVSSTLIPCTRTGLTGHSGSPTPPTVRKDKGKTKEKRSRLSKHRQKEMTKERVQSRAGLGPPPLRSPPPPCCLGALSLNLCTPPSWCARTLAPRPWPFPPIDIAPMGLLAVSTSRPPRSPSIASSSAVAVPGIS